MPKGKSGGAMSGVVCADGVTERLNGLINKQTLQYLVFALEKEGDGKIWKEIASGERLPAAKAHNLTSEEDFLENCWEGFVNEHLKETQAVWAVIDWSVKNIDKVVAIQWCPDTLKIGDKMIFSSSIESIKAAGKGIKKIMIVNEPSEVLFDVFKKDLASKI